MQDLNKYMDDLFRKAVDQYAIRPCENRWNEISGKISSNTNLPPVLNEQVKSNYAKVLIIFLIFLLIPITIVSVFQKLDENVDSDNPAGKTWIQKSKIAVTDIKKDAKCGLPLNISGSTLKFGEISTRNKKYLDIEELLNTDNNKWIPLSLKGGLIALNVFNVDKNQITETEWKNARLLKRSPGNSTHPDINPANFIFPMRKNNQIELADNVNPGKNRSLQHLDYPHRQGIYFGVVLGPLLSQVKNQGLKKSGYDFGILIGYTLGNRFSVETGLMRAKQYYFVGGDYPNLLAGGIKVISLEGSRDALEIPLVLKYSLVQNGAGNFYISAGLATYIGVSDKILINVGDNAIPPTQGFDYGANTYLPSYLNLSAGYEFNIGRRANVRLEPYVEIPLKNSKGNSFKTNITGESIQVSNSGVHVGITRFIR